MIVLSWRQFLAVFPAIIALLGMIGLAYWGSFQHAVPWGIVPFGVVAALISFLLAWSNIRWLEKRIRRLEELEIVLEKDNMERRESERAAASRAAEYAVLLSEASSTIASRLDEVRLPLHILITTRFGEVTDSQEELLQTASSAADAMRGTLSQLQQIADIDRGALAIPMEYVRITDIFASITAELSSQASRDSVSLNIEAEPALPRVWGNHMRMRDAMRFILGDIVGRSSPGSRVSVQLATQSKKVVVEIVHEAQSHFSTAAMLGRRLVSMQGGAIEEGRGKVSIVLLT